MVFGQGGIWQRFLQRAEGYMVARLRLESLDGGLYRVRDFWTWHHGFERFRERFAEDFAEFDRRVVVGLVEKQQFVGAYYEGDEHEVA